MCIAIYSPKGNQIPCEEYMKASFQHNSDGAGFAFNTDNRDVQIIKGLMTWDDFIKTFRRYDKEYDFANRGVLIHFRITTHGGTNKECCHPFPLTSDIATMRKPVCHAQYAVIHNGIISLTSADAWKADKCSDTMMFISKYLSKIATNPGWFKNKTNWELIYDLADSKLAVLDGKGNIMSTAGFTQDADGNWYSNSSYKEARVSKSATSYYGGWRWGDDYDSYPSYYGDNYVDYRTADRAKKTELLRIKPNELIITNDGDELCYGDEYNLYVTDDLAIFIQEKRYDYGTYVYNPVYYGEAYGVFTTNSMSRIPFRNDAYSYLRQSDYGYFPEPEEESDSDLKSAKDDEETRLTVYANQNK